MPPQKPVWPFVHKLERGELVHLQEREGRVQKEERGGLDFIKDERERERESRVFELGGLLVDFCFWGGVA